MKTLFQTPEELATALGDQVRRTRLLRNLSQNEVAARAGLSLNAMRRLEAGRGANLMSFLAVLRVLGRSDWLTTLAPEATVSPMQQTDRAALRRRARRKPR